MRKTREHVREWGAFRAPGREREYPCYLRDIETKRTTDLNEKNENDSSKGNEPNESPDTTGEVFPKHSKHRMVIRQMFSVELGGGEALEVAGARRT